MYIDLYFEHKQEWTYFDKSSALSWPQATLCELWVQKKSDP